MSILQHHQKSKNTSDKNIANFVRIPNGFIPPYFGNDIEGMDNFGLCGIYRVSNGFIYTVTSYYMGAYGAGDPTPDAFDIYNIKTKKMVTNIHILSYEEIRSGYPGADIEENCEAAPIPKRYRKYTAMAEIDYYSAKEVDIVESGYSPPEPYYNNNIILLVTNLGTNRSAIIAKDTESGYTKRIQTYPFIIQEGIMFPYAYYPSTVVFFTNVTTNKDKQLCYFMNNIELSRYFNSLGFYYYRQKNYKKAGELFMQSIDFYRDNFVAIYNMSCIYALRNDVTNAVKYLKILEFRGTKQALKKIKKSMSDPDYNEIKTNSFYLQYINEVFPKRQKLKTPN